MDINLTAPNMTAGSVVPGATLGFHDLIFDANSEGGHIGGPGTITVFGDTASGAFESTTFSVDFNPTGQNFITLVAQNGEVMTDVQLVMASGDSFIQFKQPRISGICDLGTVGCQLVPPIPLPATLPLFASGLGALGLLGWRRKRKSRVSLLGEPPAQASG
jgi:hypothetical protein